MSVLAGRDTGRCESSARAAASLVSACSSARVCYEHGRDDSTGFEDQSIKSASQRWQDIQTLSTDVSGARGVAAPVPRTSECRHEWTQKKNSKGWGTRTRERKEHGQLQADRKQSAFRHSYRKEPPPASDSPDIEHSTRWWRRQMQRNARFPEHRRRRTRPRSKLVGSAVAVHRRGHRDPCLDAEAVGIFQLQCTDEKVDITAESSHDSKCCRYSPIDDTVIMQTSSSSQSSTANREDASDSGSGNATEW